MPGHCAFSLEPTLCGGSCYPRKPGESASHRRCSSQRKAGLSGRTSPGGRLLDYAHAGHLGLVTASQQREEYDEPVQAPADTCRSMVPPADDTSSTLPEGMARI